MKHLEKPTLLLGTLWPVLEKITEEAEYTCKDVDVPLTSLVTIKAGHNYD